VNSTLETDKVRANCLMHMLTCQAEANDPVTT